MDCRFELVDVFGEGALTGNPLAVMAGADDLDAARMGRIARWLNLSETTFLLPPDDARADYRVRIFTPERELPFAGHPTLGTCHAWLRGGGVPRRSDVIVQQCDAGLVRVRRQDGMLAFAAPPLIRGGDVADAKLEEAAAVLGIAREAIVAAQWVDNGPGWLAVLLASAEAVLALEPARSHPSRLDLGVVGLYPPGGAYAYEVRALFSDPFGGIAEDPVTGSLNASVAQWLIASGRARAPYTVSQGGRLDRRGRIRIMSDPEGTIWVGGATRTLFSGTVDPAIRGA